MNISTLYVTADQIGAESGGGRVTQEESDALRSISGRCEIWGRKELKSPDGWAVTESDPWIWDQIAYQRIKAGLGGVKIDLAHFYAGTFSRTIEILKSRGTKISYTAAAHDIEESWREHKLNGFQFNYTHLTDKLLWDRYVEGYLEADRLIVPSEHSAICMRNFGYTKPISIIPHGVDLPNHITPLPKTFIVGYMGAYGPDKGVKYLLEAWGKLNYKDAILVLAGKDSESQYVLNLVRNYCPINSDSKVWCRGWVNKIEDFYKFVSVYVQPSVTEGFGIEVLEAMAHGRPVICSKGAGACDLVHKEGQFEPRDVNTLASKIDSCKMLADGSPLKHLGDYYREQAKKYTWDKIKQRYVDAWNGLMGYGFESPGPGV